MSENKRMIYREDPYVISVNTVIERITPNETNQTQTIFLNEQLLTYGGGQPMDHGTILVGDKYYKINEIVKEKGNMGYSIHCNPALKKGDYVTCHLDFKRRYKIMRQHTAQHLIAGCLRIILGDIFTGSMKIGEEANSCTVVYPNSLSLTENDLITALSYCQKTIQENKLISSLTVNSEAEAVEQFGKLYRSTGASGSLKGKIRLVIIDGIDVNACGGTHVRELDEIGGIQLDRFFKLGEGSEIVFSLIDI